MLSSLGDPQSGQLERSWLFLLATTTPVAIFFAMNFEINFVRPKVEEFLLSLKQSQSTKFLKVFGSRSNIFELYDMKL